MFPLVGAGRFPIPLGMGRDVDNFKRNLSAEIERQGITARALSLRAGLGPDAVRDLFRKNTGPTLDTAAALALALGKTLPQMMRDPDAAAGDDLDDAAQLVPSGKRSLAAAMLRTLATAD